MSDLTSKVPVQWDNVTLLYEELSSIICSHYSLHALDLLKERMSQCQGSAVIVDVAAGTGPFALPAAKAFPTAKVIATDLSPQQLEMARHKAEALGGLPNLEFRVMNGEALEFEDGSVDALACMFGLMYYKDRVKGLSEIYRVLKPGGQAVLSSWENLGITPLIEQARAHTLNETEVEKFPGFAMLRIVNDADALRAEALAAGNFAEVTVVPHVFVSKPFHQDDMAENIEKFLSFPMFAKAVPDGKADEFKIEFAKVLNETVDENGMVCLKNKGLVATLQK